jgi:glycogen synthase kinase 3 beta
MMTIATDDPNRMVTVTAADGKSGDERIISYNNCKVVGNGSFGVVFAARMMGAKQEDGSEAQDTEIAIKKVLQDKRFKVSLGAGHHSFAEAEVDYY